MEQANVNGLNPKFNLDDFHKEAKNCIEKGSTKPINHSDVLNQLLEQIEPINFREYLELPEDEDVKQKHIIVAIIKRLLEIASKFQWNLSKVYDYTYVYNGAYWQQFDKEEIKSFLGKVAIKMGSPEYESRHFEFKDKLLKQFLTDAHLPPPPTTQGKILINLRNGTFEVTNERSRLREFNSKDFLTYQLPFAYDENATCPTFDSYLKKVLPDKESRDVLQEFSGYIFTTLNLEKMLLLIGSGANGKSVFFNILCALLGRENVLNFTMNSFSHEYNRAKLTNVLLNYSSEKGTDLNYDTFKALVTGEPLQAREPYGKSFTLHNKVKFIINANELPKETEHTDAYFRRYLIVPFNVKIPEDGRNIFLADNIIQNELAGVFNWLLVGLKRILGQKRFTESEKSKTALEQFMQQSDNVALFIAERYYKPSSTNKVALIDLFKDYMQFCDDDGCKHLSKHKFSKRLESKGFEKTRLGGGAAAFLIETITPPF
ncbi:DNA primase family protein [Taibaiella soli]|uniref:DNA primase n=1 Tax=Taibaiella soli TaxID=1649169 RepID=A0A2W2BEK0_9BACT|nr:DNA primase family protein [Taibaiella soli]PZF74679.1 DNA primase [Taibaiella soli]